MNTFDWLTQMDIMDVDDFRVVEVSFKNGSRKAFYKLEPGQQYTTGDMVVVEAKGGFDIGRISLSGELVRMQMKKKKVKEDNLFPPVIRIANERDMERLDEARREERDLLIKARVISRTLGLDMKIGDVEFQGDKRKATFFYTANGRVDFRELIRQFAKDFRVKIEMRQIGARQESARIGGLGTCGRELCCSTWLVDFKSVSTGAARYQNLAINQAKLSGQCGRLKCCLNYELDTYMEAVQAFPNKADRIQTEAGQAVLVKTDIFKQLMFYAYTEGRDRGKLYALSIQQVKEIQAQNRQGEKPQELSILAIAAVTVDEEDEDKGYGDVHDVIELPAEQRKKKKRNNRKKRPDGSPERSSERTSERSPENRRSEGRGGAPSERKPAQPRSPQGQPVDSKPTGEQPTRNAPERGEGAGRSKNRNNKNRRPEGKANLSDAPRNNAGNREGNKPAAPAAPPAGDASTGGGDNPNKASGNSRRRKNRGRGGNRPPSTGA